MFQFRLGTVPLLRFYPHNAVEGPLERVVELPRVELQQPRVLFAVGVGVVGAKVGQKGVFIQDTLLRENKMIQYESYI